jgi:hypothetical protein
VDLEPTEILTFLKIDFLIIHNIEVDKAMTQQYKPKEIQISAHLEVEVVKIQTRVENRINKVIYLQTHMILVKAMHQNSNITSNKITQC